MVLPILYHWLCRLNPCEPQNSCEQTWLPVWCCSEAGPLVGDWVQGRAVINGINDLIKESPPPSHNWGHRETMAICEPGSGSLVWQHLVLGLPGCGAESNKCLLFRSPSVYGTWSVMAAPMDGHWPHPPPGPGLFSVLYHVMLFQLTACTLFCLFLECSLLILSCVWLF